MNTLNVENMEQKVLFDCELKGQLSDGYWENTRPYNHWKAWCDAEVRVDPDNVGRDFYAKRVNYDLTSKFLLECVGERMLRLVRAAKFLQTDNLPYEIQSAACPFMDYLGDNEPTGYYAKKRKEEIIKYLNEHNINVKDFVSAMNDESLYSMKDLRKDLKHLKKIMRVFRDEDNPVSVQDIEMKKAA